MIIQYTLPVDHEEAEARLALTDENPEIFFIGDSDRHEARVHVPSVHKHAFEQTFPEAVRLGDTADVPIFWTSQSALYRGDRRHIEQISANTLALHGTAAVAVGHNCEHDLITVYGYGSGRKLPGFYHEIGNKHYIFAVVGIEGDDETEEFLLTLYEHSGHLVEFLRLLREGATT